MTQEINTPVQRFDRDLTPVVDAHEEQMRKLKEHLSRPILAGELSGKVRLNGNALRKHADLDSIPEHPFMRQLRELREARESK
jgi:hypothetical protein